MTAQSPVPRSYRAGVRPGSRRPGRGPRTGRYPRPVDRGRDAWRAARGPVGVLALLTFALYAGYGCTRYVQYLAAGWDLGIFDQAVRAYSRFQAPLVPLKGPHYNLLGDHFHPVIAVLAPLYWLWDDPRTLLLAQAALFAASVVIVHRFARRRTSARWSTVLAAGYALGWPLQAAADFDVHEVAFAVPLLAWAIDALDRRADRALLVAGLVLLLVREDMGAVVVLLGLLRLALGWADGGRTGRAPTRAARHTAPSPVQDTPWGAVPRRVLDRWRGRAARARVRGPAAHARAGLTRGGLVGGGLVVAGVVGYLVATVLVLPHFSPTGRFGYWSYDALGPDLPSALASIARHPVHAAQLFVTPHVKLVTLAWLFGLLLLLPLRSPYVLLAVPLLAERFWSSRENLWTTEFHYSAVVWPVLVLAAVDGAQRLVPRWRPALTAALAVVVLAVPVMGTATTSGLWPLHRLVTGAAFRWTPHMADQAAILALVPPGTCVEADDRLTPHLTRTNRVSVPTRLGRPPDLVVLDLTQQTVGFQLPPPQVVRARVLAQGYRVAARRGPLVLLRRPGYAGPSPACAP